MEKYKQKEFNEKKESKLRHCKSCLYSSYLQEEYGLCKKNAITMDGFPIVNMEKDRCGEHELYCIYEDVE
jgi:hypothetical protein